jgi:hypothetical protein
MSDETQNAETEFPEAVIPSPPMRDDRPVPVGDDDPEYTSLPESPPPARQPWDQLDGESANYFSYFCAYRDLDPKIRGIYSAYFRVQRGRAPYPNEIPKKENRNSRSAPTAWYRLSTRFHWAYRAREYDKYMEIVRASVRDQEKLRNAKDLEADRRTFRRNQVSIAMAALYKAWDILKMPLIENEVTELRGGKMYVFKQVAAQPAMLLAAATLINTGSKVGRLGLGIRDDDTGDEVTPENWREKMFKTQASIESAMPEGAIHPQPSQVAVKPDFHAAMKKGGGVADLVGERANGNGNGHQITPMKGPRERP